ncbi:uncharacterized protein Ecym_2144 [Eremothecium cymbalariae DBVPG|uniref:RING-CH-type domain-containing protein n=1 Tax=Eremothecium cymbalariae (strain CBS 270.75 / DBVPG 7215 / KCTC 17166 / NRRL Y-17582) TaxID=931890 RepID=G8JNI0_ERECY|nr:Hypothetical protein Ecym_2144 [Eremothecium cymbalariae DBVPG\
MNLPFYKKSFRCWICLEDKDTRFNFSSWTHHECGCNLQVHNKCLVRWLFATNKKTWLEYGPNDYYNIQNINELKRRTCYVVDEHKDFQTDVDLAETVQTIPAVGQTWASFICLAEIAVNMIFRISDDRLNENNLWRGIPIESVDCPQCKRSIKKGQINWNSGSLMLRAFKFYKTVSKYSSVAFLFWFLYNNPLKQAFKVGLYSLRYIFPESILQKLLNTSTTKALDVYTDSVDGIDCIPSGTRFTILGFPLYLFSQVCLNTPVGYFQQLYPWVIASSCGTSMVIINFFRAEMVSIYLYSKLSLVLSRILRTKFLYLEPYFRNHKSPDDLDEKFTEELIKTTWADYISDTALVLLLARQFSRHVLKRMQFITKLVLIFDSNATPDECLCIQNLLALGILSYARDFLRFYLACLRSRELMELQSIVEDEGLS